MADDPHVEHAPIDGPVDAAICMRVLVLLMVGWTFVERHDELGYGIFIVPPWLSMAEVERLTSAAHDAVAHDRPLLIEKLRRVAAAPNN